MLCAKIHLSSCALLLVFLINHPTPFHVNNNRLNYVKDYDGGTHMECYVHPTVPYMDQAEMFDMQGKFLRERIADISSSKVVYPGLTEDVINNLEHPIDIPGSCVYTYIRARVFVCVFIFPSFFFACIFHQSLTSVGIRFWTQ